MVMFEIVITLFSWRWWRQRWLCDNGDNHDDDGHPISHVDDGAVDKDALAIERLSYQAEHLRNEAIRYVERTVSQPLQSSHWQICESETGFGKKWNEHYMMYIYHIHMWKPNHKKSLKQIKRIDSVASWLKGRKRHKKAEKATFVVQTAFWQKKCYNVIISSYLMSKAYQWQRVTGEISFKTCS